MARLIPLYEWAIEEFGDHAPCKVTLSRYAKFGMIYPPALKVGRSWMVEKDARFVGLSEPLIRPTINPALSPAANLVLKKILMDGTNK
ncbi:excisionase [Rahnella perminowiae]|uniref:excisionase n=1 Tax=Rahnella perminowiae TaxID=2816244 RepID=UPI001C26A332|nr:excisionase [Rahnella perminowiae]MBU9823903.1 excisionase [Rahnella perminowiae]